jgi:hypothetical protein
MVQLTDDQIEEVTALCQEFRAKLETCPKENPLITLKEFPHGSCGDASLLLARYLGKHDYGPFRYILGRRGERSHAWLLGHGLIIDITADQFPDFDNPCFVGEASAWYDEFEGEDLHVANCEVYGDYWAGILGQAYHHVVNSE